MDHFQIPKGATHIKLPYLGREEYDGQRLGGYPLRRGWTEAELVREGEHGIRTQEDIDAFFQTWLVFGCLITVFESVGIKVTTRDFLCTSNDGQTHLTTQKLPELMQRWRERRDGAGTWTDPQQLEAAVLGAYAGRKVMSPVKSIIEEHFRLMNRYCGADGALSPEVAIAITSIQWTLRYWERGINHSDWGIPHDFKIPDKALKYLCDRLLAADWCPSEVALLTRTMHVDSIYYIGCFQAPRYEDDHSKCNTETQACWYKDTDWKYQTRHAADGCDCEFISFPSSILDFIHKGGIPIVSWKGGEIQVTQYDAQTMRYVAISHV